MSKIIPDWLPDWADDSAYPASVDDWSLNQWVWAFIRRNEEYRTDYEHFEAVPGYWYDDEGYSHKTAKWGGRSTGSDMVFRYCEPPTLPGETCKQYYARLDGNVDVDIPLEEHLMQKWGIVNLLDPSEDFGCFDVLDDNLPEVLTLSAPYPGIKYAPPLPAPDKYGQVTLRFDLRFGIDTQIDSANKLLIETKIGLKESLAACRA